MSDVSDPEGLLDGLLMFGPSELKIIKLAQHEATMHGALFGCPVSLTKSHPYWKCLNPQCPSVLKGE